ARASACQRRCVVGAPSRRPGRAGPDDRPRGVAMSTQPDLSKRHPADRHDLIRVHGARENNLTGLDLQIPKRRLTVFTGVSGSGKSSLVFDTIAAESQRMINET